MEISEDLRKVIDNNQCEKERSHRKVGILFILPALIFVSLFLLYPIVYNVVLVFFEWDMRLSPRFVGLNNFVEALRQPYMPLTLLNTALWCTVGVILPFGIALGIASFSQGIKGQEVFKTIFFIPRLLAGVSAASLWGIMFAPEGMINILLGNAGLAAYQKEWLVEPGINTFSLLFASIWGGIGISVVLILIGFAAIPKDPVEAAKIEGVSSWKIYWDIVFPLLIPTCLVVVLMMFMGSLSGFDFIWAMTRGGPYQTSETLAVSMYREGFLSRKFGLGATLALILSSIVLAVTYLIVKLQQKYNVRS